MRWIFFRDVFGGWRWERLDGASVTIDESRRSFGSREDAETDAGLNGYASHAGPVDSVQAAQPNDEH